jgi:hypothetical protein
MPSEDLKSGIPDSVLIPAPVSTTQGCRAAISAASRSTVTGQDLRSASAVVAISAAAAAASAIVTSERCRWTKLRVSTSR